MKTIQATKKHDAGAMLRATWSTPLGPMRAVFTRQGLARLTFPGQEERITGGKEDGKADACDVALIETVIADGANEAERGEASEAALQAQVETTTDALRAFFKGEPSATLPQLDWTGASAFDQAVWRETMCIPAGEVRTYGQLAAAIGRAGAARAVGGALGRNPIVLLVPCHRVIAHAGGERRLCGFTGGLDLKRALLELETQ